MKIYIDGRIKGFSEAQGFVRIEDLTPDLIDALRVTNTETIDALNCLISFSIEVDDASEYLAYPCVESIEVFSPVDGLSVELDLDTIDTSELETRIDDRINWDDFWSDREAAHGDYLYDCFKDSD